MGITAHLVSLTPRKMAKTSKFLDEDTIKLAIAQSKTKFYDRRKNLNIQCKEFDEQAEKLRKEMKKLQMWSDEGGKGKLRKAFEAEQDKVFNAAITNLL